MGSFLQLEDCLAPPPLPALIAVLMVLGLLFLGNRLIVKLQIKLPQAPQFAAAFILVTGLAAAAVYLLTLAQAAHIYVLRILAWALALLGLIAVVDYVRFFPRLWNQVKVLWAASDWLGKVALGLSGATVLGLLLAALGPPTDSDSLHYHLGVPLDILRHHGAYLRMDWLHARLIGLGESLNLLGLAGGTDIFGAALQFAGAMAVWSAVTSLAQNPRDKILLSLAVLGCPVLAFLVPNQKPQMLPVAAMVVALILCARRFPASDLVTMALSFGCAFFAMSCKYSFLLSGMVVVGIGLIAAYRSGMLKKAILTALLGYLIFVFPLHWHNYLVYGDPISPMLEKFRAHGDPIVLRFAAYLREVAGASTWPFPLNVLFPASLGELSTVLGLGTLLGLLGFRAWRRDHVPRVLITGAILSTLLLLLCGQINSRFLMEPYFWLICSAAFVEWGPLKNICFRLLVGQMLIMTLMVAYGAVTLFPGSLTTSLRNQTMTRSAEDFAACRWLNQILPPDAVVLSDLRSLALIGRPFMDGNYLLMADLGDAADRQKVLAMIKSRGVNTLVARVPLSPRIKENLGPYLAGCLAGPREFLEGKRNPWNRQEFRIAVYRLNPNRILAATREERFAPIKGKQWAPDLRP